TSTVRTVQVGLIDKNPALIPTGLARLRTDQPIAMARSAGFRRPIRHSTVLRGEGDRAILVCPFLASPGQWDRSLSPGATWRNRPKPVLRNQPRLKERANIQAALGGGSLS